MPQYIVSPFSLLKFFFIQWSCSFPLLQLFQEPPYIPTHPTLCSVSLFLSFLSKKKKKNGTLHKFACHLCSKAVLIFCIVPVLMYVLWKHTHSGCFVFIHVGVWVFLWHTLPWVCKQIKLFCSRMCNSYWILEDVKEWKYQTI